MRYDGRLGIQFMLAYTDVLDLTLMSNAPTSKLWKYETILKYYNMVKEVLEQANEENTNEHILKFYRRIDLKYSILLDILERI